jgi:hypothetical protein
MVLLAVFLPVILSEPEKAGKKFPSLNKSMLNLVDPCAGWCVDTQGCQGSACLDGFCTGLYKNLSGDLCFSKKGSSSSFSVKSKSSKTCDRNAAAVSCVHSTTPKSDPCHEWCEKSERCSLSNFGSECRPKTGTCAHLAHTYDGTLCYGKECNDLVSFPINCVKFMEAETQTETCSTICKKINCPSSRCLKDNGPGVPGVCSDLFYTKDKSQFCYGEENTMCDSNKPVRCA